MKARRRRFYFLFATIGIVFFLGIAPSHGDIRSEKKTSAQLKQERIKRLAERKAKEREETREWRKLALAAVKQAKKNCARGKCNLNREILRLFISRKFAARVSGAPGPLKGTAANPCTGSGTTQCPPNPGRGVAVDCCSEQEACSYAAPTVGTSGARCVANQNSCKGSFCTAYNDPGIANVGDLHNCCPTPQKCEVVTVTKFFVTVNVPICATPEDKCPPGLPNGEKFKIGGKSVLVCCNENETPSVLNGAPYCEEVTCPQKPEKTTACPGKPKACCTGKETCISSKNGPANCIPTTTTTTISSTTTSTTRPPGSPTTSSSTTTKPPGSPTRPPTTSTTRSPLTTQPPSTSTTVNSTTNPPSSPSTTMPPSSPKPSPYGIEKNRI